MKLKEHFLFHFYPEWKIGCRKPESHIGQASQLGLVPGFIIFSCSLGSNYFDLTNIKSLGEPQESQSNKWDTKESKYVEIKVKADVLLQ